MGWLTGKNWLGPKTYLLTAAFVIFSFMVISVASLLTATEYIVGFSLAYYSGVSMIFLPCTFPMVLAVISIVGISGELKKSLIAAILYGLGVAISMAIIGTSLGGVGVIFGVNKATRIPWAIGGIAAIILALSQLGILKIRTQGIDTKLSRFIKGGSLYTTAFLFGIALGDAGIGCPNPAFFVLMTYITAVGDLFQGAALGLLHGLGRATPLLFIALLTLISGKQITSSISRVRGAAYSIFNYIFLGIGAYFLSIAIFGGWWCYSAIHIAWDSLIVNLGGYSVSERAVPHQAELEDITYGWPLGSWMTSLIVISAVIGKELATRRGGITLSTSGLLLIFSIGSSAALLAIAELPLFFFGFITELDLLVTNMGLSLLPIFIAGYILYRIKTKRGAEETNSYAG